MSRAADLPDPSDEWRTDEVLRELFVARGWGAGDIAFYFDVEEDEVKAALDQSDVVGRGTDAPGNQPPTSGFAAKVWRQSIAEKREAARGD